MGNVAERDPMETRSLILKEFGKVQTRIVTNPELWRKLSFDAHKELCKVLGDDFIDYPEFEFWFSRFARGKLYLDYDRSSDSKPRSFTDLPQDVFKNVGEYLELHDRLLLRDVCKDIRYQVDNWDLKVDEISFIDGSHWEVKVTNGSGSYRAKDFGKNEDNICYPAFYRNPISFVMNILMLPNLLLKKLTIDLHFMAPGVLEEIKMSPVYPKREKFSEIIESEQCQSAKTVYIESLLVTSRFPLDVLYHCPRFTVLLDDSAEKLKAEFLKKLMKYGEVQKCVVYISICRSRLSQILSYFNEPEAMVPNFPSLRRYPIPGSNEFYELEQVFLRNRTSVDRYGLQEEFVRLERKQ
ncbi:hypothetical protein CRE_11451 [Caenorhabditis remanei]|uniref:F-box domain-containing protein n=1 Tax=Caenorhabditis remanei TaxID=31234 RepID=E3NBD8_CAERE|nr:hypothetical protein CRE_11451 [Caenorhabditis remanei]